MSVGFMALLDDVAALAKMAAASLDDIAGQSMKAGGKAAGVIIDDAAVTPRYVTGLAASRELPIIGKIARGSLKNKIVILLPAALVLSLVVPQAITPLLMIGGIYLCYEGAEKIYSHVLPHAAHAHEAGVEPIPLDAKSLEDEKVASAIKTDFILSAEIMAITLAAVPDRDVVTQGAILAVVGLGLTFLVYGGVALIVKADDAGLWLASRGSRHAFAVLGRVLGRGLVQGMPYFLNLLGAVGTAAMIWVGGGIVLHGLEKYGIGWPMAVLHDAGAIVAALAPAIGGFAHWMVEAVGAGLAGLLIGFLTIPAMSHVVSPIWRGAKSLLRRSASSR
jgi:predicted DNA repair protein MutK